MTCGQVSVQTVPGNGGVSFQQCCTPSSGGGVEPPLGILNAPPPPAILSLPGNSFVQLNGRVGGPPSTIANPVSIKNANPVPRPFFDQFIDALRFSTNGTLAVKNALPPVTGGGGSVGIPTT